MKIGGIQKFSLIDYPGKTCAIIFTIGCNFRCKYCHNPELVIPEQYAKEIPIQEIFSFLESRKNKLDAICITGGEPTLHADLIDFIKEIKKMGFLVKLDSNGSNPEVLKEIIDKKLIDYIAMDVKALPEKYDKIIGWKISADKLSKSIDLIMNSGIDYEFRTTITRELTSLKDLEDIAKKIKGAKRYFLQKFIPTKLNDPSFMNATTYSDEELKELSKKLIKYVAFCGVR
jgi:pyruvate formate lyase activating enzyme